MFFLKKPILTIYQTAKKTCNTAYNLDISAQYFDLAIILTSDETTVLDANTQNLNLDYKYDYLKGLFFPMYVF